MTAQSLGRRRWGLALRWTARVWSGLSIVLLIAFTIGEGFNPSGTTEIVGSLFFPIGVAVGMAVGWRREVLGGTITLVSMLAFYATHFVTGGDWPRGWAFLVFAAPGFLYLLATAISPRTRTPAGAPAS